MGPSAKPPRNGSILQETIHSYLSTMERQSRSNLIKLLFADDASIVSSTNSEDTAYQNQIQSQDDQHGSQAMDIIEDDIVQNEESEAVAENQSKKENVVLTKFTNIKVSSETKCPQIRQNLHAGHHVLEKV